jgi:basic membrane lipoprotein Med (substrate-binding protein (PBP1-ABC) superfamily)
MSAEVLRLAPQFPATQFAVMDMPRLEQDIPGNVMPVRCRRAEAYYEAGKRCGTVLSSDRFLQLGNRIGVIASGMTKAEKELLAEFERGFSSVHDARFIVTEELGSVSDRAKAALTVENLLNREIRLFLVKTYGLNGVCLEKITAADAFFIIEDFSVFNLFPEKCLLSIEDDYTEVLSTILKAEGFRPPTVPTGVARARKGVLLERQE